MGSHLVRVSSEELSEILGFPKERASLCGRIAVLTAEVDALTGERDGLLRVAEQAAGSSLAVADATRRPCSHTADASAHVAVAAEADAVHVVRAPNAPADHTSDVDGGTEAGDRLARTVVTERLDAGTVVAVTPAMPKLVGNMVVFDASPRTGKTLRVS